MFFHNFQALARPLLLTTRPPTIMMSRATILPPSSFRVGITRPVHSVQFLSLTPSRNNSTQTLKHISGIHSAHQRLSPTYTGKARSQQVWAAPIEGGMMATDPLSFEVIDVHNPDELNVIIGHAHFIKTVEDVYEAIFQSGTAIKFGLAFCEASEGHPAMPGLKVRFDGNDQKLIDLAKGNAMKIGAGHTFVVFLDHGFPVNVLNAIKQVPEVCRIYCATANPLQLVMAKTGENKKGIMGVIDGLCPNSYETEEDKEKRKDFLRMVGYKR